MGYWSNRASSPTPAATTTARHSISEQRRLSPAPYACAVSPLVPMRMNEQFQYMTLNLVTPLCNAPIVSAESLPTRPATDVDTSPINGTVMLDTMFGRAMRSICLFISVNLSGQS